MRIMGSFTERLGNRRDSTELKTRMADFVVRRIIDVMGDNKVIYADMKKQAPIGAPEEYGLEGFEERFVTSADGSRIGIWYKPPTDPDKPTYVAFHGRGGHWGFADNKKPPKHRTGPFKNNCYRHNWLEAMADSGAGVVAVHTRGFGKSANPSINEITEDALKQDMVAVDQFLEAEGIDPRNTITTGESLGGALATILTETMAERGHAPAMLGLVNSFSTMSGALRDAVGYFGIGKFQPLKHATEENISKRLKNPLNTQSRIASLQRDTKLYIAQAPEDAVVRRHHAQRNLESGRTNQLDATFRALVNNFCTTYEREHTNWEPRELVKDMESAFKSRMRGNIQPDTGVSR
jgi:pimeloyl-ACP methyl ester carboxylesterase